MEEIKEKTLNELIEESISLGFPREVAETFKVKAQVQGVINTLKAKEVVEKVDSLEEKLNPNEEKKLLRQYQTKAQIMMDKWLAAPMSQILVPSEPGSQPGKVEWRRDKNGKPYQVALTPGNTIEEVIVNGAHWLVPKGCLVEVPGPVAQIVADRLQLTSMAGSNIILDRVDDRTGRPMSEIL